MQLYSRTERLMGSSFSFGVIAPHEKSANEYLQLAVEEVIRLENKLSEFIPSSSTFILNQHAHQNWVTVDKETYQLLKRSYSLSKLTEGDFDITVAPLKKLYKFVKQNSHLPSEAKIKSALNKVGYQKMMLDDATNVVKFSCDGMRISFAAIGKGYAADCVSKLWQKNGLKSGYVDASGDIRTIGVKQDGQAWKSGIANPDNIDEVLLNINLSNAAIATSGDSEQFFKYQGEKYSHNINPKNGKPLQFIKSVTVVSPSAELSDALATAVYVKGTMDGIDFINQLPKTHAIIIDDQNKMHLSNKLNYENTSINSDALLCV